MTEIDRCASTPGLWRPFQDAPVLTPPMILGLDHAAPADRDRLIAYLTQVLRTRPVPIHVNVAFNAAYFGFDLSTASYVGGLELDDLAPVDPSGPVNALPVGALIQVPTGSGPMLGEVIYKEGAHPDLAPDGHVPPWLSGAPAGATGPGRLEPGEGPVILRERLVVDVDALGTGLSLTHIQIERMARRGRILDQDAHLIVDARYANRLEADMVETAYYARHLLTTARNQLLSAAVPMPLNVALLPGAPYEQLEAALLGLLDTVQTALGRIEEARTWGGYAFTRASLATRLQDPGPLGGQDLRLIATEIERSAVHTRLGRWAPQRAIEYTAVGPLLRTVAGSGPALHGAGYATAVCHANAVICDDAHRAVDDDGLLPGQVHLRLDDAWQGGGVWRTERPGSTHILTDIAEPLGLGWTSTLPAQPLPGLRETPPQAEVEGLPIADLLEEDADEGPCDFTVTDSQVTWTHVLRLAHQNDGRLPLPAPIVAQLRTVDRPGVRMRITLRHDGYLLDPAEASQLAESNLHQSHPSLDSISWPLEYFAAIVLACTWPRGGGVVHITSTLLQIPVVVDGQQVEHRYDPSAFTRDQRPAVSSGCADRATLGPAAQVLAAVRAHGSLGPAGTAVLAATRVADAIAAVFGPAPFDVDGAVQEAVATQRLAFATGSGTPQHWSFPPHPGEPKLAVVIYTPVVTPGMPRAPRHPGVPLTHWVTEAHVQRHLRKIGHLGQVPSATAVAAFRADRAKFGWSGPLELPEGYTYVTAHERSYGR